MLNFTCLTLKSVYCCRVLIFFYLSKINLIIKLKFGFYYYCFTCNYYFFIITFITYNALHYIQLLCCFMKKISFVLIWKNACLDIFTEKSC